MYETEAAAWLELAPDTKARLAELFAGRTCCRCPEPAARVARGKFLCPAHYERGRPPAGGPRVYRCAAADGR